MLFYSLYPSQMDEVIDNIMSMQSSYDDFQSYTDPVQMSNTVSRDTKVCDLKNP